MQEQENYYEMLLELNNLSQKLDDSLDSKIINIDIFLLEFMSFVFKYPKLKDYFIQNVQKYFNLTKQENYIKFKNDIELFLNSHFQDLDIKVNKSFDLADLLDEPFKLKQLNEKESKKILNAREKELDNVRNALYLGRWELNEDIMLAQLRFHKNFGDKYLELHEKQKKLCKNIAETLDFYVLFNCQLPANTLGFTTIDFYNIFSLTNKYCLYYIASSIKGVIYHLRRYIIQLKQIWSLKVIGKEINITKTEIQDEEILDKLDGSNRLIDVYKAFKFYMINRSKAPTANELTEYINKTYGVKYPKGTIEKYIKRIGEKLDIQENPKKELEKLISDLINKNK